VKHSSDINLGDVPDSVAALYPAPTIDALLALRRDLHRHPELSLHEERTATQIEAQLAALGITDVSRVAGTGIVARIPGSDAARRSDIPPVAIRGDIDALPIHEETGFDWASETPGVMHACGHDVHASWAVAAAGLLVATPAPGDVLVVFQPAEEIGTGAWAILESGVLDGVRAMFGGHADRRFAVGEAVVQPGPLAAASDLFEIELIGRAAHGGRPHEGDDPIVVMASLVLSLQTIVSRRINPAWPAVISIGTISAGTAPNIIPERAAISGTIRTQITAVREQIHEELERLVQGTAAAHGLTAEFRLKAGAPPVINSDRGAKWAHTAATSVLGEAGIVPLGYANMASEDFGCYLERMDGCFMRVGARETGGEFIPGHAPNFYAADAAIFVGAAVFAESARVASAELADAL